MFALVQNWKPCQKLRFLLDPLTRMLEGKLLRNPRAISSCPYNTKEDRVKLSVCVCMLLQNRSSDASLATLTQDKEGGGGG